MNYEFTKQQKDNINEHWGNDFYRTLYYTLKFLSEQWKLSDLEFGEYYSQNAVFFCKSELHGDCVLRIARDSNQAWDDYNVFREYNGGRCVRAFEHESGAALIERAVPGKSLGDEPSLEKRLAAFSELFNGMHIEPKKPELFGTYTKWVNDAVDYIIDRREDNKEAYPHALKAKEIYSEIISVYDRKTLIHLDLGNTNIVSCGNGKYKIIDPYRTVIGDPVFETGKFIFVECLWYGIEPEKTEIVLDYLEKSLNIPNKILRQCLYLCELIDCIERASWSTNWNGKIDNRILFAESIMYRK